MLGKPWHGAIVGKSDGGPVNVPISKSMLQVRALEVAHRIAKLHPEDCQVLVEHLRHELNRQVPLLEESKVVFDADDDERDMVQEALDASRRMAETCDALAGRIR